MRHPSGNIKQIPGSEFREEFQTRDKKNWELSAKDGI